MVSTQQTKITITLPMQIKQEVLRLKNDLNMSMNSIYQTAIEEYVKQKNREKLANFTNILPPLSLLAFH